MGKQKRARRRAGASREVRTPRPAAAARAAESPRRRTLPVVGVAAGVALAAAAGVVVLRAGDGGDDASAAAAPFDRKAFCEGWTGLTPLITEESVAADDGDNRVRAGKMLDSLRHGGTPPDAVADEVEEVTDAIRGAQHSDRHAYDDPRRQELMNTISSWAHTACGYTRVDITYRDHSFKGMPEVLPSGPTSFQGIQRGREPHVMNIYRIRDGVPGTPEEVLDRAQEQPIPSAALFESAELVAVGAFTDFDGEPGFVQVDLRPGRYLVIDPIPTGINRERVPPQGAKPHFLNGMVESFTVR